MKKNTNKNIGILFILGLLLFAIHPNNAFSANLDFSTNESTVNSFYSVKEETLDMADKGLPVLGVFNIVTQAEIVLESLNYKKLALSTKEIDDLNKRVIFISENIEKNRIKLTELKAREYNLSLEEKTLNSTIENFKIENYDDAESLITGLTKTIDSRIITISGNLPQTVASLKNTVKQDDIQTPLVQEIADETANSIAAKDYSVTIKLINEIDRINQSIVLIVGINKAISELKGKGFNYARFDDLRSEAINALTNREYEGVSLVNDEIKALLQELYDADSIIASTKEKLDTLQYLNGINDVNNSLSMAVREFNNENYEDAQALGQESYDALSKLEAQSLLFGAVSVEKFRFSLSAFIKESLWLTPIIILIIVLLVFIYNKIGKIIIIRIYNKRIEAFEKERKTIDSLIKKNQMEYYVKQMIDKETYNAAVSKYQERLIKISSDVPILKDRIGRLSAGKSKNG